MPQPFTKTDIRRLAVMRQRLAGPRAPATTDGIMDLFRDLRCVQIDPLRAVERTQPVSYTHLTLPTSDLV